MSESVEHPTSDALAPLRDDLRAEQDDLDAIVRDLGDERWHAVTPSPGWDVADQIAHLTYFDARATTALLDPVAFQTSVEALMAGAGARGLDEYTLGAFRDLSPHERLARWREARATLNDAAASLEARSRVAWYGPSMSARSFLSARLMETWAHGSDVADALGVTRRATKRLRHVAELGVRTREWSYRVRGEEPPTGEVRVELQGPDGDRWTWGHDGVHDTLSGSAEEFCLVVTQRRHLDDTSLIAGELARHWLLRAQAFAGGPSQGPEPRRT